MIQPDLLNVKVVNVYLTSHVLMAYFLFMSLIRQQYAQALAQQKAAALSSAPLQQQQQHQQQINLLLQQYQALKMRLVTLNLSCLLSYVLIYQFKGGYRYRP